MFLNEFVVNVFWVMLMFVILQVENENVFIMWGKWKSDWEVEDVQNVEGDVKFICLELCFVKLMRKFIFFVVVKVDVISVVCVDGVLMVIVFKLLFVKLE